MPAALVLVWQFRLWDDLEDLPFDRIHHPDRVLVASGMRGGFVVVVVATVVVVVATVVVVVATVVVVAPRVVVVAPSVVVVVARVVVVGRSVVVVVVVVQPTIGVFVHPVEGEQLSVVHGLASLQFGARQVASQQAFGAPASQVSGNSVTLLPHTGHGVRQFI